MATGNEPGRTYLPSAGDARPAPLVWRERQRAVLSRRGHAGAQRPLLRAGGAAARRDVAAEHTGTSQPSELAHVLARMDVAAYERRHRLLAGLRALPTGRFFVGSEDVYPEIIDSWRRPSTPMLAAVRSAA